MAVWSAPTLLALALLVAQDLQIPAPTGFVNDFANVIPDGREAAIDRIVQDVRAKSGGEIAVVTLPSIGDRDVSDVALRIGREWGVGARGEAGDPRLNAGVVVLVVPKETNADGRGRCWISTGRGTEGFILDSDAGRLCRQAVPYFAQQDYGRGIEVLTFRVAEEFAQEFGFQLDTALARQVAPAPVQRSARGISPLTLLFLFFVFMMIMSAISRGGGGRGGRRRRGGFYPIIIPGPPRGGGWGGGGWGGGGGFGGFGGFGGGGGFSGGGGGSSW